MIKNRIGTDIHYAASLLEAGDLVVIPTETVYGLAANPFNPEAVDKIYSLKNRPRTNPLILHIASVEQVDEFAKDIPDVARILMQHFWPGPLTLLLPKKENVPDQVTAGSPRVALRVPRNEITLKLLKTIHFPLVAPSANPFTYISPTKPEHLLYCYGANTPYVLDGGECEEGIESTIIGFEKDQIIVYRLGAITTEAIQEVSGLDIKLFSSAESKEITPGMHHKHYSPRTTVRLEDINTMEKLSLEDAGWITFSKPIDRRNSYFLGEKGLKTAASKLYATLYEIDQLGLQTIVIEKVEEIELGRAIMDRLRRSASK